MQWGSYPRVMHPDVCIKCSNPYFPFTRIIKNQPASRESLAFLSFSCNLFLPPHTHTRNYRLAWEKIIMPQESYTATLWGQFQFDITTICCAIPFNDQIIINLFKLIVLEIYHFTLLLQSVVMLMFREEKSPEDEIKAWQFWHGRQHSIKQRILDAGK